MRVRPTRHDRGQTTPLMALLIVGALVAAAAVAHVGVAADAAARARTAADAAALAGAEGGERRAAAMAAANGGDLVAFHHDGGRVEVVVEVGGVAARARSEIIVEWVP